MKILIALHQCMDLGGIINHTEQLIGGLKDLGHTVHLKEMIWTVSTADQRKDDIFEVGPSGVQHHQGKGWNFKRSQRIAYRGAAALSSAKQILSQYDMIVWTVPVPSKNKNNIGNNDWPELYDLPKNIKQVAFIHDGNAHKGAGHLIAVEHHLDAIACVHPCALKGAEIFNVPRAMVVNPQEEVFPFYPEWEDKRKGFVNMQTFKAWKQVHELVEAIRYMPPKGENELREIAGKGIEYRYMTSEEKCKQKYFHSDGTRFWDAALQNGMRHHDYWDSFDVDEWVSNSRVLVDPSWSNNYSKFGGHFNRVVVDAMIRGTIPVAREMGMGNELFKAGVHYVAIPQSADPQEYADIILETSEMPKKRYLDMIHEQRELLPMFERKTVAKRLIDLAYGNVETEETQGKMDPSYGSKIADRLFDHFGVLI